MEAASRGERPVYTSRGSYPMMLRFDTSLPGYMSSGTTWTMPNAPREAMKSMWGLFAASRGVRSPREGIGQSAIPSPMRMMYFLPTLPPLLETEHLQDLPHVRRDGDGLHGLRDRVVRVLQAVAGKGADDPLPLAEKRLLAQFYHAGNRCRRRGFAEYPIGFGHKLVRLEDLPIADHADQAPRLVARRLGLLPGSGVPDPDRGRDRLGLPYRAPPHDGSGPLGLPPEHPREAFRSAGRP